MRQQDKAAASGVGLGLRSVHYDHILSRRPAVPWFEVISENYMGPRAGGTTSRAVPGEYYRQGPRGGAGGRPLEILERVRADYPVALHGVSLNIGSADPLDSDYLKRLRALADRVQPWTISDHLCWTGVGGENLHDLLPLPYTEEALRHVSARIRKVQEALGRRILIENVSSYLGYRHSAMTEWEFLAEIASQSDCGILLDVNNIHVSAVNHRFDARDYLEGIPVDRVGQMHLAGYSEADGFLIDTHDHPVSDPVWQLYEAAVRRFGRVPTLIEWDDKIPSFARLQKEAARARKIQNATTNREPALAR